MNWNCVFPLINSSALLFVRVFIIPFCPLFIFVFFFLNYIFSWSWSFQELYSFVIFLYVYFSSFSSIPYTCPGALHTFKLKGASCIQNILFINNRWDLCWTSMKFYNLCSKHQKDNLILICNLNVENEGQYIVSPLILELLPALQDLALRSEFLSSACNRGVRCTKC